jgi:hypothetical protein
MLTESHIQGRLRINRILVNQTHTRIALKGHRGCGKSVGAAS